MTIGTFELLSTNRRFRWFWLGCTLSVMGDAFTKVAFIWLVYERTRSAAAVSLLMVFYLGPLLIGGLTAGWALDRFERVRVMIVDCVIRAVAIGIIPLLHVVGALEVWHVYLAAAIYGLFMMVTLAGAPTLIPSLVAPHELNAANSLESLSYSIGGVVGPAVAGTLIVAIGAPMTVLVDVVTYLAFAATLATLAIPKAGASVAATDEPNGYWSMLSMLAGTPMLLATTVMFCIFNIGEGAMAVWLPFLTDRILSGGPQLYGLLLGVLAAGEMLGAILAGSYVGRRLGLGICVVQTLSGIAALLIALIPSLTTTALGLFLVGAFSAPMTVWAQTLRMQTIPPELHGRAFALLRLMMQGGNPVGAALSGPLFQMIGVFGLIAASAAMMGLPGAVGFAVKGLRRAERT
jgi:MFS family permease